MRPRVIDFLGSLLPPELVPYLVPTGTTLLLAAILTVFWVMSARARRVGLRPAAVAGASLTGVLCGLVGSRLFVLIQHLPRTLERPEAIFNLSGGSASWGGYSLGLLGFFLYLKFRREPLLAHADLLASALGLGPFIARWGCFMNGCCYGKVSTLPWAVRFPAQSFAQTAEIRAGLLPNDSALSLPLHPVQAYASVAGLILFLVVSRFWRTHHHRRGLTFAFYWLLYGAFRFVTELARGDVPRYGWLPATLSQQLSLGLVAGAALVLWRSGRTRPPGTAGAGVG